MSVRIDAMDPTSFKIISGMSFSTTIGPYISSFILLMNFTVILLTVALLARIASSLRTFLTSTLLSNLKRVAYFNAHRSISVINRKLWM
ncbi:hypothetical protein MACJ_003610 [Theileria orientalis]|uniref:ABC transporter n=1 Tax=Theileria orientalis TaxID=68886 RepID=A0A976SLE6_THEOR|nr:hypothetical protein MACJ_003610 [Theileria orientalis]